MESILYNSTDKEVAIILGYGIGNHLCLKYLTDIVYEIRKMFPLLQGKDLNNLQFLEVNRSSIRHRHMWYTKFSYDLGKHQGDFKIPGTKQSVYAFSDHPGDPNGYRKEPESAKSTMSRLIHD